MTILLHFVILVMVYNPWDDEVRNFCGILIVERVADCAYRKCYFVSSFLAIEMDLKIILTPS